jgi:glycosyltransferase involved in cell wall biosynthesis
MQATLEQIRRAPSILDVIPLSEPFAARALAIARDGGRAAETVRSELVEATRDPADAPTAIVAAHALARLPGRASVEALADLLEDRAWLAGHVAWSLADREPLEPLVGPLVELVAGGRIGGMLAQRTLARWAASGTVAIAAEVARHLPATTEQLARARLVETLGIVGGSDDDLLVLATDGEPDEVRVAAIAALGDRPGAGAPELTALAAGDGRAAGAARLAIVDQGIGPFPATPVAAGPDRGTAGTGRLRVAQVHLGGHLDRELAHAGQGSTGGIATLLVQLGDALAADPRVAAVTTIGRGTAAEALAGLEAPQARIAPSGDHHVVLPAPLGRHEDASFAAGWPAVFAAERGLRRILARRPPTLLHLRMADVGSLAASRIARRAGIPTVFTLAPDPHAVIAEMERAGELDRTSFGPADAAAALWYRARLVRYLAVSARQVVLFPRSELATRLRELLSIDIAAATERYHVVPEGIDPAPVAAARREVATPPGVPPVIADLRAAVAALGAGRRGLPLVVSVGRMAEVKGMARLVEAFAADEALRRRANLVIVGGDLDDPTPEERAEIERIEAVFAPHPEMAEALVLLGHRRHDDVLRVLAVAEVGLPPEVAPGGAYACGSRKEEFGIAIVEALAAGLPVVAPWAGGPASYVDHGVTGCLVDTLDRPALAAAIHAALDLTELPGRADRARALVAERFTIGAMADALVPVYEEASRPSGEPAPAGSSR